MRVIGFMIGFNVPLSQAERVMGTLRSEHFTSRRGNMNGQCEGQNLRVKPSDSCPFMDWSKTSSAPGGTCCRRVITESFEVARSSLGTQ